MRNQFIRLTLSAVTLLLAGPAATLAQDGFPNTKELGRAATEYRDDALHLVAAYYHSQLEHDNRWLLIEAAFTTEELSTVPRTAFRLVMPDGVEVPLAEQRHFSADHPRVRQLLQNASLTRHDVVSYFNRRGRVEQFQFFTVPSGQTVHVDVQADQFRVAAGDLFFEAPTGAWAEGLYTLILEHEDLRAAVPIELR